MCKIPSAPEEESNFKDANKAATQYLNCIKLRLLATVQWYGSWRLWGFTLDRQEHSAKCIAVL